jgi:uncharacterized protein YbbC (DUF1343 family)
MVRTGLEKCLNRFPAGLRGKRIGILCHASSITPDFKHITEHFYKSKESKMTAIFGPQHGLFGQTQDNMIEWNGHLHPAYQIPVFSLYGEHRKPTKEMLNKIDALVVDLQDVGARLYTYIWTVKLCIEACTEAGIPVWILDRPNPIAPLDFDGPVLKEDFFTFVGGASIPLCHRMTLGEMALWIKEKYFLKCDLNIIGLDNWKRSMMYNETGLPWVIPSPNMPRLETAVVYPGMVLIEALNLSEGRGTTIPFELFGAPFIDSEALKKNVEARKINGFKLRIHNFIPTFNKFSGELCQGLQIHITDIHSFHPVSTAMEIFEAIIETSPDNALKFNPPPYEYEYVKLPFDILSGDTGIRETLQNKSSIKTEIERWKEETELFRNEFERMALYSE